MKAAIALAVALFLITVIVRLPARVLGPLLPAALRCERPGGTIWSGSCEQVTAEGIALGPIRWHLEPLGLLKARLAAEVYSDDPRADGRVHVQLGSGGDLALRNLIVTLPLAHGLSVWPAGWSGTVHLDVRSARLRGQRLTAATGVAMLERLHSSLFGADLGTMRLRFAPSSPGGPIVGTLSEPQGPLALNGRLQLQPGGTYSIQGEVAARPGATPQLTRALQLLGAAGTDGRRHFSLSGSL